MKYYSIEDENGGLRGYVKAKDSVDANQKVLDYWPGIACKDNRMISEVDKYEIISNAGKEIWKQLKRKDLVEC